MKYNHIIFLPRNDFYWVCYSDLSQLDNCKLFRDIKTRSPFFSFLSRIHHSQKINNLIDLPFKSIWYKSFYDISFPKKRPLCFTFFVGILEPQWKRKFIEFLRKKYPTAKFVGYYTDLVNAPHRIVLNKPEAISSLFDELINYDREDAVKYGMSYYPTTFSNVVKSEACGKKKDVYFLGKAKDRFEKIISVFNQLTSSGLKCDFYLVDVPEEKRILKEGLHYIKYMSYEDNLNHIQNSRCILELMQSGAVGYTIRTWESIQFDKCLITDNLGLFNTEYYDNRYVSFINQEIVDVDYIKNYKRFNNPLKTKIRPKGFLSFIENLLTKEQNT
ncbi:MAG: hypothetical protein MJZ05_04435 [Fibrobacter sp.]|nr:hypothetical protein [Fibrobacter sp.]